jgi:hypothetical protein
MIIDLSAKYRISANVLPIAVLSFNLQPKKCPLMDFTLHLKPKLPIRRRATHGKQPTAIAQDFAHHNLYGLSRQQPLHSSSFVARVAP